MEFTTINDTMLATEDLEAFQRTLKEYAQGEYIASNGFVYGGWFVQAELAMLFPTSENPHVPDPSGCATLGFLLTAVAPVPADLCTCGSEWCSDLKRYQEACVNPPNAAQYAQRKVAIDFPREWTVQRACENFDHIVEEHDFPPVRELVAEAAMKAGSALWTGTKPLKN